MTYAIDLIIHDKILWLKKINPIINSHIKLYIICDDSVYIIILIKN